jgi:hypothetical protein
MIERVNHTSGAMIGKKDIAVRPAGSKQIENMGKRVRSRNGAKRALRVIEAVKVTAGRWR